MHSEMQKKGKKHEMNKWLIHSGLQLAGEALD